MKKKIALITGVTGQDGSYLAEFLLKKGYKLTHMKQILSSWRKTKNSLSSNPIQKICDAFKMYYRIENKNLTLSIYSVLVLAYNKLKK